jgi:hypothetical protein
MKKLLTIKSRGEGYTADLIDNEDGSAQFLADMDIDIDGSPDWARDPFGQPETTLRYNGKPINGQVIPFIVLPPEVIKAFTGVVLGCLAQVFYKGRVSWAVVADEGPHSKLGEGSPALARALGINDDPNHGGVDEQEVLYKIWPGKAANVAGVQFALHPYGSYGEHAA